MSAPGTNLSAPGPGLSAPGTNLSVPSHSLSAPGADFPCLVSVCPHLVLIFPFLSQVCPCPYRYFRAWSWSLRCGRPLSYLKSQTTQSLGGELVRVLAEQVSDQLVRETHLQNLLDWRGLHDVVQVAPWRWGCCCCCCCCRCCSCRRRGRWLKLARAKSEMKG